MGLLRRANENLQADGGLWELFGDAFDQAIQSAKNTEATPKQGTQVPPKEGTQPTPKRGTRPPRNGGTEV
jgi:hypothetical protein